MRVNVSAPATRPSERSYILDVVLGEFLGIDYELTTHSEDCVRISMPGAAGMIEMPDILLSTAADCWRREASLPPEPVQSMELEGDSGKLPALYAGAHLQKGVAVSGELQHIPLDVFGSCFYLLARYEEVSANPEVLDEHGRFPANASLLQREGLLERPLVDEYVALLAFYIERLWPGLQRATGEYQPVLTHDVDHPMSSVGEQFKLVLRRSAGDLVRRRDPQMMIRRLHSWFSNDVTGDPNNTFAWIMDHSERLGVPSRFHFMAATKTRYDSGYDIGSPILLDVLREVSVRGHEIGIHPSYRTSREPKLLATEVAKLELAVRDSGVQNWSKTSRQHYLRWNAATTWAELAAVGIDEDSSVGFADAAGFRCGTSRRFSVYDWSSGRKLALRELPLIVMDVTLSGKAYLNLDWEQALEKAGNLAAHCRLHRSPFTLLWHNDKVMTDTDKRRYLELLETVA